MMEGYFFFGTQRFGDAFASLHDKGSRFQQRPLCRVVCAVIDLQETYSHQLIGSGEPHISYRYGACTSIHSYL